MAFQKKTLRTAVALAGLVAAVSAGGASAASFNVGDTKANLYGFAKLDTIYDVDNNLGNTTARPRIQLDGIEGQDGDFKMHAYQSRLGFKTATPQDGSVLKTHLEVDFFGDTPEGGELRLRHAYGSYDGILAGKTWTNFKGGYGKTPLIDMTPAPGQSKVGRKAQVRYSMGDWHVALENPDADDYRDAVTSGIRANGTYIAHADQQHSAPDMTVRFENKLHNMGYHASGVLRQLNVENDVVNDRALGWGASFGANYEVNSRITVRGSLVYGDGIGEYLQNNPTAPGYVDGDEIETVTAYGGGLGMTIKDNRNGAFSVGYGMSRADVDDMKEAGVMGAEGVNEQFEALHANYMWSPTDNLTYGVEVGYHTRDIADGQDGDALRFQGMAKYHF